MRKIICGFLLSVNFLAALAAAQTYDREKIWEQEIEAFAEIDRRQTPPENAVLFVGSSSVRGWRSLSADLPELNVINRGFGGSRLTDVNHYFDRIVAPYKPKIIVLYAGENDIYEGIAPETLPEDYRRFSALVKQQLPKTKILYILLQPSPSRWKVADQFRKANDLIKAETEKDKRARFVDVWTPMPGANGEPLPDIFLGDKLCMNDKGYKI